SEAVGHAGKHAFVRLAGGAAGRRLPSPRILVSKLHQIEAHRPGEPLEQRPQLAAHARLDLETESSGARAVGRLLDISGTRSGQVQATKVHAEERWKQRLDDVGAHPKAFAR